MEDTNERVHIESDEIVQESKVDINDGTERMDTGKGYVSVLKNRNAKNDLNKIAGMKNRFQKSSR